MHECINGLQCTRFEDSGHFLYILLLVWHVLPRLTGPHQIKCVIWEVHVEGIHDLEAAIMEALLCC